MKHVLGLVVALLALASASAATAAVSVNISASTVPQCSQDLGPGCPIFLSVYATADAGEVDNTIFGALNFPDALVNSNAAGNSQTPLFSSQGALTCTTAFCVAFSQVNPAGPIAVNLTNVLLATTTFFIDAPPNTVINFTWRTTPSTQRFDFFGLTNAPGISLTMGQFLVPEPGTAALLDAGLLGLGFAARRHRA